MSWKPLGNLLGGKAIDDTNRKKAHATMRKMIEELATKMGDEPMALFYRSGKVGYITRVGPKEYTLSFDPGRRHSLKEILNAVYNPQAKSFPALVGFNNKAYFGLASEWDMVKRGQFQYRI